jgi:hypothetical protein
MAICTACRQEMTDPAVTTCRANDCLRITAHNWIPTVRYESDSGERCPDCNVATGGHHHPGCDREKCPECQRQRITCRCSSKRRP